MIQPQWLGSKPWCGQTGCKSQSAFGRWDGRHLQTSKRWQTGDDGYLHHSAERRSPNNPGLRQYTGPADPTSIRTLRVRWNDLNIPESMKRRPGRAVRLPAVMVCPTCGQPNRVAEPIAKG